jgi:hypothetical protein
MGRIFGCIRAMNQGKHLKRAALCALADGQM